MCYLGSEILKAEKGGRGNEILKLGWSKRIVRGRWRAMQRCIRGECDIPPKGVNSSDKDTCIMLYGLFMGIGYGQF